MAQPFGKVAFKLKEGEYTKEPVKTPLGYLIIYVEKKAVISFKKVKNAIDKKLKDIKYNNWYKSL